MKGSHNFHFGANCFFKSVHVFGCQIIYTLSPSNTHTHTRSNERQSGGVKLCYADGARLVTDHTAFYSLTELITQSCVSALPAKRNAGGEGEGGGSK